MKVALRKLLIVCAMKLIIIALYAYSKPNRSIGRLGMTLVLVLLYFFGGEFFSARLIYCNLSREALLHEAAYVIW